MNPRKNMPEIKDMPDMEEVLRTSLNEKVPAEVEARLRNRLAAFRQRMEQQELRREKENPIMSILRMAYTTKLGRLCAAAVMLAVIILALGLFPWPHTSNLAFADVVRQIQALRTLTCNFTGTVEVEEGEPAVTTKGKSMWMTPGRSRNEIVTDIPEPAMHMEMVQIVDAVEGRSLGLMPSEKKAIIIRLEGQTPEMQRNLARSIVDALEELRDGTETPLGTRDIASRKATGFHVEKSGVVCEAWVDPETGLPIEVEMKTKMFGNSTITYTDFVFNPPLDESLFSLTPPEGYTLMDTPKAVDLSPPTEQDLLAMFQQLREVFQQLRESGGESFPQGLFPKECNMNSCLEVIKQAVKEKEAAAKPQEKLPPEKVMERVKAMTETMTKTMMALMTKVTRGTMFVQTLKPENDFHYVGAGVRFGESEKPVCWWKPDGFKSYRVIYGDLSVRDVMPDNLPAAK